MPNTEWKPNAVIGGDRNRVLASDYLEARSEAWEHGRFDDGHHMDPVITDFREEDDIKLWLAFMAGSYWERSHRGRRYADELNTTT